MARTAYALTYCSPGFSRADRESVEIICTFEVDDSIDFEDIIMPDHNRGDDYFYFMTKDDCLRWESEGVDKFGRSYFVYGTDIDLIFTAEHTSFNKVAELVDFLNAQSVDVLEEFAPFEVKEEDTDKPIFKEGEKVYRILKNKPVGKAFNYSHEKNFYAYTKRGRANVKHARAQEIDDMMKVPVPVTFEPIAPQKKNPPIEARSTSDNSLLPKKSTEPRFIATCVEDPQVWCLSSSDNPDNRKIRLYINERKVERALKSGDIQVG